jgi:hypothetical protein
MIIAPHKTSWQHPPRISAEPMKAQGLFKEVSHRQHQKMLCGLKKQQVNPEGGFSQSE